MLGHKALRPMLLASYLVLLFDVVNAKSIVYDALVIESGIGMAVKRRDWQAQVKGLLKAELKRRNLSYGDLAERQMRPFAASI